MKEFFSFKLPFKGFLIRIFVRLTSQWGILCCFISHYIIHDLDFGWFSIIISVILILFGFFIGWGLRRSFVKKDLIDNKIVKIFSWIITLFFVGFAAGFWYLTIVLMIDKIICYFSA